MEERRIYNRNETEKKNKKFVRYKEAAEMYSMGLTKIQEIAKDAGAIYKVDKVVLVNTEILDKYIESFRIRPQDNYYLGRR